MAIKDTDRQARANYKKKVKTVRVELYGTDEDIKKYLEWVEGKGESIQGHIKTLIRANIDRIKNPDRDIEWYRKGEAHAIKEFTERMIAAGVKTNCPNCGHTIVQMGDGKK